MIVDIDGMVALTKTMKKLGVSKFSVNPVSVEFFAQVESVKTMSIPLDQLPKSDEELKKEQDELLYWSSGGKQ